jgi:hypothetical protein
VAGQELARELAQTLSHEFGSTPPAFRILDHRFTLGATAMSAWKK